MSPSRRAAAALTITAALAVVLDAQPSQVTVNAAAVKAAIDRGLAVAPAGFERLTAPTQAGVRVLDVSVDRLRFDVAGVRLDRDPPEIEYVIAAF